MGFRIETAYCSILFLTIISHLSEGLNRFGCPFQNNAYAYPLTNIFGDDGLSRQTIQAKVYHSVADLNEDLAYLYRVVGNAIDGKLYNDVEELIEFHNFFRHPDNENITFDNLFNRYHPIYRAGTPFHRLVTIFDTISYDREDFEQHSYFVTVDESLSNFQIPRVTGSVNPNFLKPDRIAAAVLFLIEGRLGFFIIDPQATFEHVAVVMHDGQSLPGGVTFPRTSSNNTFSYRVVNDYVVASIVNSRRLPHVYFMRSAFCGMLDRTQKLNLLNLAGLIETKDRDGQSVNKFEFKFTAVGRQKIDFDWYGNEGEKCSFVLDHQTTLEELANQNGPEFSNGYLYLTAWFNHGVGIHGGIQAKLDKIREIGLDGTFIGAVNTKRRAIEDYRNMLITTSRDFQSGFTL